MDLMDIGFLTPIHYRGFKTKEQNQLETVDAYFGWWKKRAVVIGGQSQGKEEWLFLEKTRAPYTVKHVLTIGAICLSYLTGVVPLAFLIAKKVLRGRHHFCLITPTSHKTKKTQAVAQKAFGKLSPNNLPSPPVEQKARGDGNALKKKAREQAWNAWTSGKKGETQGKEKIVHDAFKACFGFSNALEESLQQGESEITKPLEAKHFLGEALMSWNPEKGSEMFRKVVEHHLPKDLLEAFDKCPIEEQRMWSSILAGGSSLEGQDLVTSSETNFLKEVNLFHAVSSSIPPEVRQQWVIRLLNQNPEGVARLIDHIPLSAQEKEALSPNFEMYLADWSNDPDRCIQIGEALPLGQKKKALELAKISLEKQAAKYRESSPHNIKTLIALAMSYREVDPKVSSALIEKAFSYYRETKEKLLKEYFDNLSHFLAIEAAFALYFFKVEDARGKEMLTQVFKNEERLEDKISYSNHAGEIDRLETLSLALIGIDKIAAFKLAKRVHELRNYAPKLRNYAPKMLQEHSWLDRWFVEFLKQWEGKSGEELQTLLSKVTSDYSLDLSLLIAIGKGWKAIGNEQEAINAFEDALSRVGTAGYGLGLPAFQMEACIRLAALIP